MSTLPSRLGPPLTAHAAYDYAHVDVFAERPLEGNQLAVFADARGLADEEMQAIAREINLSETTFILPRDPLVEHERGVRVRIFTKREELPFAGHPTLGTASWLYWNHPWLQAAEEIVLELNVGPIPVRFTPSRSGEQGIFGSMRQNDPVFGATQSHAELASVLGLSVGDLDQDLPVQTVSTGNPFCIVPLKSMEVASRLSVPQTAQVSEYLERHEARFFYFVTHASEASGADWHARMMFYGTEDPATGSAAGPAIAWMVRHGAVESERQTVIEQGVEMLRPSRLHVSARWDGEKVSEVYVGGRTIPVAMGRLFLP
ncbi:MAG: PhzF family phenazine biosynthesis protein [Edaphobacter sp.]|uniref:PhzF family phenazine biosynthesis protein n=1 Tax=Edaphobacter sp. TaxID=1934404 RepID=UPI0023971736|nr:PhzF family phenazine biosynthesis protein [Edaphobacter sp.]MDE1176459.1 PhzF family phenazine biosynthesis protein [Edaphobacter sp.]